uniref:Solute carrier family 17 member 9b n=1 Tax=Oryzias sinensis TaxID=183150 RepID=A0A8C7XMN5_9TELE
MAVIQKHGKSCSPDLVCFKENHPPDKTGVAGGHKKCPEHHTNWPRPVARVWTVVLLLGTCLLYCARVAMPICAVSMAEKFNWTKRESGMVLGSFFWGYCFTQVFGGYVSDRVGGEKVLLLAAAAWGSMTAFTPILAHLCSQPILSMTLARFLMGLLQGVHYPSLASLCSQKVVESERGFLMSTVGSGSYLGTLLIGGAGSLMLDLYGWESVFYISGFMSVLWAYCMWKYLLKGEGPLISLESLGSGGSQSKLTKRHWLRLFKQRAVWAVIVTHLCTASTYFTLLSWLPTFFKESFPDAKGWVFNVIPWLVAIPSSLFSGCLSDHLISQGVDTVSVRKLMQVQYLKMPYYRNLSVCTVCTSLIALPVGGSVHFHCCALCVLIFLCSFSPWVCLVCLPSFYVATLRSSGLWHLCQPPWASPPSVTVVFLLTFKTLPLPVLDLCLVL